MELIGEKKGHALRIKLLGELDHHSAQHIREALDSMLKDENILDLQLDMRGVTFMDSSGIGVLLGRYRVLSKRGGRMAVLGMSEQVDRILGLSGIYNVIERKAK